MTEQVDATTSQAEPVSMPERPKMIIFVDPPEMPTQKGPEGILYDFNKGCRVALPAINEGSAKWKLRFFDTETFNVVFEVESEGGFYQSSKVYYVPFKIEVWRGERKVFEHDYCARDKPVLVQIPMQGTVGDAIAWFPFADLFQKKHGCKLTFVLAAPLIELFKVDYPNVNFVTPQELRELPQDFYATYRVCLYFNDWHCTHQPTDYRRLSLPGVAATILGMDETKEVVPKIHIPNPERTIAEPYVCIAVQSSTQCKYWNNPYGWRSVIKFLKDAGYRVLCIDRDAMGGSGLTWTGIPHGAEDMTGALPLTERAALLKHADFFVGLSSGLSWLAWAVGTPVVMISGFTHPHNEFYTPYRVFNHHACNSCWHDPKFMFDHFDFLWCPRHKGDNQQIECSRLITAEQVQAYIEKIPGFLGKKSKPEAIAVEAAT